MTESLWWHPHLGGWSQAVGWVPAVKTYDTADPRRKLGDWWRNGGSWCLHLDRHHYALFEGQGLADDLRRSLTWTLQTLSKPEAEGDWREPLLGLLSQASVLPFQDLLATRPNWVGGLGDVALNHFEGLPGYLVWVHFHPKVDARHKSTAWQSAVTEIVEAVLPGGWIGWTKDRGTPASAFLFCPVELLSDGKDEAAASDFTPDTPGQPEADLGARTEEERLLRQVMLQLLQNLETDAYLPAEATVSHRIEDLQQLGVGVVTLVAAWQARHRHSAANKVLLWAEQRLFSLLLAVPESVVELFLHTDHRGPDKTAPGQALPPDLSSVLHGVMKANLNVSEAARLLYLHRNTLLHRIERIRQLTGYDIRNFDDALILLLTQFLNNKS